jgi:hypothetical protein
MNVRVGDIVILKNVELADFYFSSHIGIKQKVVRIYNGQLFTEFINYSGRDDGFTFHMDSTYASYCEVVPRFLSKELKKYSFV